MSLRGGASKATARVDDVTSACEALCVAADVLRRLRSPAEVNSVRR